MKKTALLLSLVLANPHAGAASSADWKAQEGPLYSLQRFHDELLRYGAPPLPLLRERMLKNPKQWPAILR